MPSITIRDEQGTELLSSDLQATGLGRYFRTAASLRSVVPLAHLFSKPLTAADGARRLDLVVDQEIPVGDTGELALTIGAVAGLGIHQPGTSIVEGSDLSAPVVVPPGTAFGSVSVDALLRARVSAAAGRVLFGFGAGTAFRYAYFHPFDLVAGTPTVAEAVKTTLAAAVFPGSVEDLEQLPAGAYVSVAGEGDLHFQARASLSSSANLLATPGLPILGSVAITQGAAVDVEAEWTASGGFELRLHRADAHTVRLAFHRRHGQSLRLSATALAGVTATVRGRELLSMLMRGISPDPEADLLALVDAGLEDSQIEAIQQAIAASVDRSLSLSAQLQVSALRDDQALFAYDLDLARLDQAGREAVDAALHGRLAGLDRLAAEDGAAVRLIASASTTLRSRQTTWRINLLGLLNTASFTELVRRGSVTWDPVSGALTAADEISSRRIRVTSLPLVSDTGKLRRVLFESLMITAAYQASRVLGTTLALTAEQAWFEQRAKTSRQDLEEDYRVLVALGLCDSQERDARIAGADDFGASTLLVQNHFNAAACDALFLDGAGTPHPQTRYESIARQALLALLPAADPSRAYRRLALETDTTWQRVRALGSELDQALPSSIRHNPLRLNIVRGDAVTVIWWARAMHEAAVELAAMRGFLASRDAASLAADPAFVRARAHLSEALSRVVATTDARFDDPWDLLAMDAAAARLGRLDSAVLTSRFAARYAETDAAPLAAAAPASRRALDAPPAALRAEARDWTPEERDVFMRHVVNLRNGRLSDSGSFSSSTSQVEAIFRQHLPAYVRAQAAAGLPARVLFFAHGGLVDEREGLRPVLARRRFWELNGIYPVYFVWETGLRETLRDILGSFLPTPDARRTITDLAIETLARNGGKQVWGRMKTSAANTVAADGGGRLVADLAAGLWQETGGTVEFHAVGHSAGSILLAEFLPLLVAQAPAGLPPVDLRSLHFLAPALTTEQFKQQLLPLIGPGRPITRLTMFTMDDEHERADGSLRPYGKSLLYLVSGAFESAVPTPLLGMQAGLRRDLRLVRFFGLAGTQQVADVCFAVTGDATPADARTHSISHGGFDNDPATMTSLVRRVLAAGPQTPVVDYFEEPVAGDERRTAADTPAAEVASPAKPRPAPTRRRGPAGSAARRPRSARKS